LSRNTNLKADPNPNPNLNPNPNPNANPIDVYSIHKNERHNAPPTYRMKCRNPPIVFTRIRSHFLTRLCSWR